MEKIIPTILSTKIKQMRSTPCFDQNNEERDGSIVSSVPGTICMSTFNLGKKLTLENVFDQSIALAAHEFSHLMGADEALAVALQKEIILDLSGMSSLRTYSDIYNQIIFRNLYEIARYPGYDGDYNGHISAMWIDSFRMELGKIMYPNDFSILTKERLDLVKNVYQQFSVFTIGTERYNALFGSKNEVSAADVMREAKIIDIPASSETFMIQKVVDQATYNNLLLRMIDQFKQMKSWRYSFENLSFEDEMLNWH